METEKNTYELCKKCQISFPQDKIDELGLCKECRNNQGTTIDENGRRWTSMRYSIIGVYEGLSQHLSPKQIIDLFTLTCRECAYEEEMWTSSRCRKCCFWSNVQPDDRPTHFVPK